VTTLATEIPEPVEASQTQWRERVLLLAIPILVIVTYLPAIRGGYVWDDDDYVVNNLTLRTTEGLRDIWLAPRASPQYYPLVFTTFWVEYQLWKLHPLGYHLVNVLLHAANALLLYLVLRKLDVPAAAVTAAMFALHPVHVESVAWVTERKNVLSALLFLCAMLAYLRFRPFESERPRKWAWYGAALALFVLALLSKTVTCTLPGVLLIILWWKRGRVTWRDVGLVAPMLAIGLVAGLMTARMETSHVGALGEEWSLSFAGRIVLAARVAIFYVVKDLWPHPLIFFYPRWQIDPSLATQWLYPAAVATVVLALFVLRNRIGRAPFVAAAIYLVTLFPAMGFFNVYPMRYSYVADHFQYLASIPVLAAVVAGVALVLRRIRPTPAAVAVPLVVIVLSTLGVLTYRQSRVYAGLETLWTDTIQNNPRAWAAWNNLGFVFAERGDYDGAIRHYEQALALKTDHADAVLNIAMAREAQGRFFDAEESYHKALRMRPKYAAALVNLSTLHGKRGNLILAESYARQALEASPQSIPARLNLAMAVAGQGRASEAVVLLREAVRLNPWSTPARVALAANLFNTGRRAEGIAEARTAVRRDPQSTLARDVLAKIQAASQAAPPAP
jgi:tetratricopeptide (TPR) repeat protein